jgi:Tfp pilus assembly protein PilO
MEKLLQLRHRLGALGLAALAVMAAAAGFDFVVVKPLEASNAQLEKRVSLQAPRTGAGEPGQAASKVAQVYAYLQKEEETTDWLAKLHGIGAATGVQLKSASYRTEKTAGRIVRYEMVLPLAGSYPQMRDFLQRALAEIPVMSIDQLTLKRESRDDGTLQAELRVTLHMVKS